MRSPSRPRPGTLVSADLELVRPLSSGGMGSVWVAKHEKLMTEVAVKFIASNLEDDPAVCARFEREATRTSRVQSPHVVRTLDYGISTEGRPFIVLELLVGRDLRARLRDAKRLAPAEALSIANQLAHALAKAHELGLVHRDLKPSNVFLCESGCGAFVKLLDFGIAKETGPDGALTTTSAIGTPSYMSPEQLTGEQAVDHRCDVWALGVLVFEMLTGQRPFVGATTGALALAIHTLPLPSARALAPSLPDGVDAWFGRACARDPAARFPSITDAARALEVALSPPRPWLTAVEPAAASSETVTDARDTQPRPRRARARLAGAGALVAAAGALAALASSPHATVASALAAPAVALSAAPSAGSTPPPAAEQESVTRAQDGPPGPPSAARIAAAPPVVPSPAPPSRSSRKPAPTALSATEGAARALAPPAAATGASTLAAPAASGSAAVPAPPAGPSAAASVNPFALPLLRK